jgi:hypothetical protein
LPAWTELFGGDAVVAAAILNRLLDGAAVINIKGGSWRLREHQALTQPLAQLNDPPESPPKRRRYPHPWRTTSTATFDEQKARISVSTDTLSGVDGGVLGTCGPLKHASGDPPAFEGCALPALEVQHLRGGVSFRISRSSRSKAQRYMVSPIRGALYPTEL